MAVVTITGPTSAGKSTIEQELQKLGLGRAISHTTRLPRVGEQNGVHYHFVTDMEFDSIASAGGFIETNKLGTRRYGKSKTSVLAALAAGQHVSVIVEPNGADNIHRFCRTRHIPVLGVWVDCSPAEQARRWVSRLAGDMIVGKEAVGAYAERLALMLTEEAEWRERAASDHISWSSPYRYALKVLNSSEHSPAATAQRIVAHLT